MFSNDIVNDPFKSLQCSDSREDYSDHLADLMQFVLRVGPMARSCDYKIKLTTKQLAAAVELANIVESEGTNVTGDDYVSAIHTLAWSLFTVDYVSNEKDRFLDPVIQHFIGCCLSRAGQFKSVQLVSPQAAKVQYVMRTVVFLKCHWDSTSPASENHSLL